MDSLSSAISSHSPASCSASQSPNPPGANEVLVGQAWTEWKSGFGDTSGGSLAQG